MKKIGSFLMVLCLLAAMVIVPGVVQAEAQGTMRMDAKVYTGPSDTYTTLMDHTLTTGTSVTVRTRYWNGTATWLQVEFRYNGARARGYVPSDAVNASLNRVPYEAPLCAGVIYMTGEYIGCSPMVVGAVGYRTSITWGASCLVYEVEDGYALVEYYSTDVWKKCRGWLPLTDLQAEMYFRSDSYYGVAKADQSLYVPSPTSAPSTYYGYTTGYPVGCMVTVVSGNCHIKQSPTDTAQTVAYAFVGERYEILQCQAGYTSTGKDWYLIRQGSTYGWISSGLVSID